MSRAPRTRRESGLAGRQAAGARSLAWAWFVRMELGVGEEPFRFTTGLRNRRWDCGDGAGATDWQGLGQVAGLELQGSGGEIQARDVKVFLAAAGEAAQRLAGERVRGRSLKIWLNFMDEAGAVVSARLVEDAAQDRPDYTDDGEEAKLALLAQGDFAFFEQRGVRLWNAEHQRAWLEQLGEDGDSDTGFDGMDEIPQNQEAWFAPSE